MRMGALHSKSLRKVPGAGLRRRREEASGSASRRLAPEGMRRGAGCSPLPALGERGLYFALAAALTRGELTAPDVIAPAHSVQSASARLHA